ncbi:helix-turn-helix transcriptional regulator [Mucilaginibacter panaciglaebae]|uniref:HTH cro/C1-type domain-containing protein n=1 Tax=Mucilaginibacter panaciglaebae TaxID=502331 RepID=A0ABP7WNV1_9SPHI
MAVKCATYIRKKRKVSQSDLALEIAVHPNVLGRYERDETLPSIEVAAKIAKALNVSLDYLVELSDTELDSTVLARIDSIATLPEHDKQRIFTVVDALVRDAKPRNTKAQPNGWACGIIVAAYYSFEISIT